MKNNRKIVCLCGSTRFYEAFQKANYEETMKGNIVLSVGFYPHSQTKAHGQEIGCTQEQKIMLDELHKDKILMADEIFVLNVDGYIGESTWSEIKFAASHGKKIRYLDKSGPCSSCKDIEDRDLDSSCGSPCEMCEIVR